MLQHYDLIAKAIISRLDVSMARLSYGELAPLTMARDATLDQRCFGRQSLLCHLNKIHD